MPKPTPRGWGSEPLAQVAHAVSPSTHAAVRARPQETWTHRKEEDCPRPLQLERWAKKRAGRGKRGCRWEAKTTNQKRRRIGALP